MPSARTEDVTELTEIARRMRRDIVRATTAAASGHPSTSLSMVEILTVLYFGGRESGAELRVVSGRNMIDLSDEEIESAKLESKKTLELTQFVDYDDIDVLYYEKPYFVVPADDLARLVPDYVTLPRGVTSSSGEVAWLRDPR